MFSAPLNQAAAGLVRNGIFEEVLLYGLQRGTEMKSRKKHIEDPDEFRAAMSGVRPLKPDNRQVFPAEKPAAIPRQTRLDEQAVMDQLLDDPGDHPGLETGEELLFLRPGYPPRLLRRLRRGQFSIGDCIDLHQLSVDSAREVLLRFLAEAQRQALGCVRVVHGKGLRSRGAPKLKFLTRNLLRRHPAVVAFASCRPVDGGTGAVNVLLKSGYKAAR